MHLKVVLCFYAILDNQYNLLNMFASFSRLVVGWCTFLSGQVSEAPGATFEDRLETG